jgi:hypothetical protein
MALGDTILTKTAGGGQKIELRLIRTDPDYPHAGVEILIDGARRGSGGRVYAIAPTKGVRRAIGGESGRKGDAMVGLTDAEAVSVQAAIGAARAELRAAYDPTDAGKRDALRRERERLVDAKAVAWGHWSDARERAFAEDTGIGSPDRRAIDAALAALAAFDAAHPEVASALRAARDAEHAHGFVARGLD